MSAKTPARIPNRLTDCTSIDLQMAWIERSLKDGRVLSDTGLWLAGVDHPGRLIARLRKSGCRIATTRKVIHDAAGEAHVDLAWALKH